SGDTGPPTSTPCGSRHPGCQRTSSSQSSMMLNGASFAGNSNKCASLKEHSSRRAISPRVKKRERPHPRRRAERTHSQKTFALSGRHLFERDRWARIETTTFLVEPIATFPTVV